MASMRCSGSRSLNGRCSLESIRRFGSVNWRPCLPRLAMSSLRVGPLHWVFSKAHVWWYRLGFITCDWPQRDGCNRNVHCGRWATEPINIMIATISHSCNWRTISLGDSARMRGECVLRLRCWNSKLGKHTQVFMRSLRVARW